MSEIAEIDHGEREIKTQAERRDHAERSTDRWLKGEYEQMESQRKKTGSFYSFYLVSWPDNNKVIATQMHGWQREL